MTIIETFVEEFFAELKRETKMSTPKRIKAWAVYGTFGFQAAYKYREHAEKDAEKRAKVGGYDAWVEPCVVLLPTKNQVRKTK